MPRAAQLRGPAFGFNALLTELLAFNAAFGVRDLRDARRSKATSLRHATVCMHFTHNTFWSASSQSKVRLGNLRVGVLICAA